MRRALAASLVIVLVGSATYAWMAPFKTGGTPVETPRVETARLFAAPLDVSPNPASDLIAIKLATQPVIWPDAPKPQVRGKTKSAAPTAKKSKQVAKPKPKKAAVVTGSL